MAKARIKSQFIRVYNCGRQMISLQLRPPGGDFFLTEQQIQVRPGKQVDIPKSHMNKNQIENLRARKHIQIVYDSENDKS